MDLPELLATVESLAGEMKRGGVCPLTEVMDFARRYPDPLSAEEVCDLAQPEYIRYLRENLWERLAQETCGRPFEGLSFNEQQRIDLDALLEIVKAHEQVQADKEATAI